MYDLLGEIIHYAEIVAVALLIIYILVLVVKYLIGSRQSEEEIILERSPKPAVRPLRRRAERPMRRAPLRVRERPTPRRLVAPSPATGRIPVDYFYGRVLEGESLGRKPGRIVLLRTLGAGSYGVVFVGRLEIDGQRTENVAVKVFGRVSEEYGITYIEPPRKPSDLRDFFNEVNTLKTLKKRHFIPLLKEEDMRRLVALSVEKTYYGVADDEELFEKYPLAEWIADLPYFFSKANRNIAGIKLFSSRYAVRGEFEIPEDYWNNPVFTATELAEGNLDDLAGNVEREEVVSMLCQVSGALSLIYVASSLRIQEGEVSVIRPRIHMDVKPQNILYRRTREGRLKFLVTDFGLASVATYRTLKWVRGTPLYMPPEYLLYPSMRLYPSYDVYSLGVTTLKMLKGRVPLYQYALVAVSKHKEIKGTEIQRKAMEEAITYMSLYGVSEKLARTFISELGWLAYEGIEIPAKRGKQFLKRVSINLKRLQEKVRGSPIYSLDLRPGLGGELDKIVTDMVSIDREERPASVLDLYFRLRATLREKYAEYVGMDRANL